MSEPAKSANEIEDVLSSIRRLVSEGQASVAPSRLVLTPAQRVVEPDDPWAPVPDAATAPDATAPVTGAADPAWGLEDRLSDWGEIESSGQEAVEEALAERSVAVPPGPADAIGAVAALSGEAEDDGQDQPAFEAETGDTNWPDAGATRTLRDLALVRGHPVQDVGAEPEVPEQGREGMAVVGEGDAPQHDDAVTDAARVAETPETMPAEDSADDGATPDATTPQDEGAEAVPGEVEAAAVAEANPVAEAENMADAEGVAETEVAAKAPPRMFSRPIRRDPEPVTGADADSDMDEDDDLDVEDLGDDPQPFSFPETEDGILDEETLRQIVADVVRAELQGVLGQRITRNVRKMVRREVRLALAAQELE
ncbi:hypothetical protein [Roseicyclus marinus]|uniref:Uncharacterized protein n=1 Tax=Roseicyclus marinus TaxID=2161673 RepID=A0AA48H0S3_9RHOB|nr:hypothetical protein MACH21_06460 [Roseicyclus marinus]